MLDSGGATSSWEERDAVGVEHMFGEVGGGSRRIADGYVDVPPVVGGGNEAGVNQEFQAKARLVRNSVTDCRGPIWKVML